MQIFTADSLTFDSLNWKIRCFCNVHSSRVEIICRDCSIVSTSKCSIVSTSKWGLKV